MMFLLGFILGCYVTYKIAGDSDKLAVFTIIFTVLLVIPFEFIRKLFTKRRD